MNVNTLLEGSSPYQVLSQESAKLAGKWAKSGLLEGIESSTERNNMSMLLENQAKQLVNEANATSTTVSAGTGNSEAWAGVSLPLVRRIFGEIVTKELTSRFDLLPRLPIWNRYRKPSSRRVCLWCYY